MAENFNIDAARRGYFDRRDRLRSFVNDLNAIIDYYNNSPESEEEESNQKLGMRNDLNRVQSRIDELRNELN